MPLNGINFCPQASMFTIYLAISAKGSYLIEFAPKPRNCPLYYDRSPRSTYYIHSSNSAPNVTEKLDM